MSQASQVRTYDPADSVVFLKTNERFGGLSNMAPGFPLRVNGVRIRTSEALYQACRFPHMPDVQRQIIDEHSPMTAKMRGKPFRKDSRSDWDAVRVKIMRWCLRVKLAQNWKEFGRLLLATGERPIVERSRKDDFWGAKVAEDGSLVGMNVLGRLLMELREQLKGDEAESLRAVEPPPIPDFLLFQRPIETIFADERSPVRPVGIEPRSVQATVVASPHRESPQPSLFNQPMIAKGQMDIQTNPAVVTNRNKDPKPYSGYRNSAHDWLGAAPEHWQVVRSKYLFREVDDRTDTGTETLLSMRQAHGLIPHAKVSTKPVTPEDLKGYKRVQAGQMVLNRMQASNGMFAVAREDGLVSPDYAVFRLLKPIEPDYFVELFKTNIYRAKFRQESKGLGTGMSGFLRLYSDRFGTIPVPNPPEEEQRKIVSYIRNYDQRIRKLVRNKRNLAEAASERLKLITHDAMRSNQAQQIRLEVASHLISRPIPRIASDSYTPIGLYNRGRGLFKKAETLGEDLGDSDFYWVRSGDLILSGQFAWEGAVALADIDADGCIASHRYPILRGAEGIVDTSYLLAFFRSDYGQLLLDIHSRGAAGRNRPLNIRTLRKEKILIPSKQAQNEIRRAVDLELAIRRRFLSELSKIKEYRERLIADVVTGKVDVRRIESPVAADEPMINDVEELEDELETDDTDVMEGADAEE
jgi:type I restriction enzyme S subunit